MYEILQEFVISSICNIIVDVFLAYVVSTRATSSAYVFEPIADMGNLRVSSAYAWPTTNQNQFILCISAEGIAIETFIRSD